MLTLKVAGFDWDQGNLEKCVKHGTDRNTIEEFFKGKIWIGPDLRHSSKEERLIAIGKNSKGRAMVVVFTLRQQGAETLIRPISARYMHAKEAARYEEAFAENED